MFLEHTLIVKDGQESHLRRIFQFLVDPTCKIEKINFRDLYDINIRQSFSSQAFYLFLYLFST